MMNAAQGSGLHSETCMWEAMEGESIHCEERRKHSRQIDT